MEGRPWERRNADARAYNQVHIIKDCVEGLKQVNLFSSRARDFQDCGRECGLVSTKYVGIETLIKPVNISVVLLQVALQKLIKFN